ncbi:hypothetical protein Q9L58_008135 [Maublancomyces gigas]|uniref:Uncharacterized protein n=1 Tax=Discina gigas TaxID=1032678 RepID=A0ABR3GAK5_9PEZI
MAAPRPNRRRALGPRDANIFPPLKQCDDGSDNHNGDPRKRGGVWSRRTDDGRISKAARYYASRRKVEGRGATTVNEDIRGDSWVGSTDSGAVGGGGFNAEGEEEAEEEEEEQLQPAAECFDNRSSGGGGDGGATSTSACAAAATTLRLRLRMALFKVQTNQTAVPISHLQLPQPPPPQPLCVFPPSPVRINEAPGEAEEETEDEEGEEGRREEEEEGEEQQEQRDGGNQYYYDDDDDDVTVSPPPSSPPLMGGVYYTGRGIPFPTPMRSSSPSPSYGKPLDIGSSSAYGPSSNPSSSF